MKFFITGHTGFKGSWLTVMLHELGHEVFGFSAGVPRGGLFEIAGLDQRVSRHSLGDVRDSLALERALNAAQPDVAIHLAAQALVLPSYLDPIETFTTNVDGTLAFLKAVSQSPRTRVSLVITSDKVYANSGRRNFSEEDPLGGSDPYSASKAMADILARSWVTSGFSDSIYVARAGNVIGAYDNSPYRIIADIWRARDEQKPLVVRNPSHIRPWQHVLDCLSGYLLYSKKVMLGVELPRVLNFGPPPDNVRTVGEVVEAIEDRLPSGVSMGVPTESFETSVLTLDSRKASQSLGWKNVVAFERAVQMSVPLVKPENPFGFVRDQVRAFVETSGAHLDLPAR